MVSAWSAGRLYFPCMRSLVFALTLVTNVVPSLGAQNPGAPPAAPARAARDTIAHRPGPMNYFFRSFVIPGWGQASLDRKLTGALFIGFEGLAISMAMKANAELPYLDRTDSLTAASRRAERQDWIVLIVFNHLFSALEAYVSAHLLDFPPDLRIRAMPLPGPRTGFGVHIGLPR